MFHRIAQYPIILGPDGLSYRPRAYAQPRSDDTWAGFLVFFPLDSGARIVSTLEQIVHPTLAGVAAWAEGVSTASLHDGLVCALSLELSASGEAALFELHADWSDLDRAADDARAAAEVAEDVAEQYEADAAAARVTAEALEDELSVKKKRAR
jgi:hypothetical protein